VAEIAAAVGKSFQTVYREIERNSKPEGTYQPWWAHNQALRRRKRPTLVTLRVGSSLRDAVGWKLDRTWSRQ
jgi:IS30 family transposase